MAWHGMDGVLHDDCMSSRRNGFLHSFMGVAVAWMDMDVYDGVLKGGKKGRGFWGHVECT